LTTDTITSDNTPTLTGTANANAWVTVLQAGTSVGKVQANGSGAWSFTVPSAVADGTYAFTTKQEDAAGNLSAASSALNVTVDTAVASPQLARFKLEDTFDSNANGWTGSATISGGKANASAAATILSNAISLTVGTTYTLVFDYVRTSQDGSKIRVSNNTSDTGFFTPQTLAASGTYSLTFVAARNGITLAGDTYTFSGTIDNLVLFESGSPTTYSANPQLKGLAEAGATVTLYDNGSATPLGTAVANAAGVWAYNSSLSSGSHRITATQTDVAGNVSALSVGYAFSIAVVPVVLDLNRDGELSYSQVLMDANSDGQPDHSAWVAATDGVLVWDQHHDGHVHDHSQYTFAQHDTTAAAQGRTATDLSGLAAAFDTNKDGVFDAQDALFAEFSVWQDSNQNGETDAGEVRSLADWGIASIDLQSDGVARSPATGVHEAGRSSATTSDGSSFLVGDVAFDFTALTRVDVASAQNAQINLGTDASANLLQLGLSDVLALPNVDAFTDSNTTLVSGPGLGAGAGAAGVHQLMVTGDANDVVDIDTSSWTSTHTVVAVDGQTYQVYNATNATAQLLIDTHIVHAGHVL
jgi:hypothetical protein